MRVVAAFRFLSFFAAPPCRVGRLLLPFPWRVFGPATLKRWLFVVFRMDSKGAKVAFRDFPIGFQRCKVLLLPFPWRVFAPGCYFEKVAFRGFPIGFRRCKGLQIL